MDSTREMRLNLQEIMQAIDQLKVLNLEHLEDVEFALEENERLQIVRKLEKTSDTYQNYC
jgi:hypothetical protein